MRSPIDVLTGRVGGFTKTEIARRTVPCYKHVIEKDGERLSLCMLVDSGKLYRLPDEDSRASRASRSRRVICAARWSTSAYVSSSLDCAAMSTEQKKPAESLVQGLLAEKRELKVQLERVRMELAETREGSSGPDPRLKDLEVEVERLRHQLATARADANVLREERDELRAGIEKALEQIADLSVEA